MTRQTKTQQAKETTEAKAAEAPEANGGTKLPSGNVRVDS